MPMLWGLIKSEYNPLRVMLEFLPQVALTRVLSHVTPLRVYARRLALHGAQLVLERPLRRVLDVLMHYGTRRAHHPAVLRTFAHHLANLLRLFALPDVHERRVVDVAHALLPILFLKSVAGHYLAPRVDEEVHHASLTRQHAATALDIVDKSHVEPRTEPTLRMLLLQLPFYQLLEVVRNFILVRDYIIAFMEVIRVVEGRRGEFHTERKRKLVERKHVLGVVVADGTAEADVLQPHMLQG